MKRGSGMKNHREEDINLEMEKYQDPFRRDSPVSGPAATYCLIARLSFFSTLAILLCKRPAWPFR